MPVVIPVFKASMIKLFLGNEVTNDDTMTMLYRKVIEKKGSEDILSFGEKVWTEGKVSDSGKQNMSISRKHVLSAINEIDNRGINPDERSSTYDLIYSTNRYPPQISLFIST